MQSWTIGILCYNEKGTIEKIFKDVYKFLNDNVRKFEIIIIDDCSTDGSTEIINKLGATYPEIVRVVLHQPNKGIGASIRDVYENARMENVTWVPGDGQFNVFELLPFLSFNKQEFISFYRVENTEYSIFRNYLSLFNRKFNQFFLGLSLKDVNWIKIYKTEVIQSFDWNMQSSIIETEICSKLAYLGIKPKEIKSKYLQREYGVSKGSSFAIIFMVVKELWSLMLVINKFKFQYKLKEAKK